MVPKFVLKIIKSTVMKDVKRRRKFYPPHGLYNEKLHIPYIDDGSIYHQYAVYLAKNRQHKACVIDIHGGAYMFCDHMDNYYIATKMLEKGFDFFTPDYEPNNGKRDTFDLVADTIKCLNHFFEHLTDYDLQGDSFFLMGDSAGGHFALLIAELFNDKNLQEQLGFHLPDIEIKGVLVNSPVYDFAKIEDSLSKGAMKMMFGGGYTIEKMKMLSPREHLSSLKMPVFLSTCKNDFLRNEALTLYDDLVKRGTPPTFIDIYSNKPNISHVHNVIYPELHESKYVNKAMADFMVSLLK